ncbi:MAG: L,D-transpeptidase [Candidatus Parcubacteria bacterium]|nr:L,D-transpeptidase [Candidatus Parcubacteria bacterium]
MLRLRWKLLLIFFLITCTSTLAKAQLLEYGTALCGDTVSFYCHTVGMTTTTVEVKTSEGVNLKEKEVLETWELLWGDTVERHIVMNINRRNTPLKKGDKISVPCDMSGKTFMDFSPYPLKIEPTGSKFLIWDPSLLAYGAYDAEGNLIRWGAGVGGKDYCPDVKRGCRTKTGEFRIISKQGPSYRSGRYPIGCSGKKCALMPYAMFFASGYAFHTGKVPGAHASHGCVRLFAEDAKWLNQNFVEVGMRVIIKPYPQISIIRIVAPIISGLFL